MTDVHCHVSGGDPAVREFLIGRDFFGVHPWECLDGVLASTCPLADVEPWLREKFDNVPKLGTTSEISRFRRASRRSFVRMDCQWADRRLHSSPRGAAETKARFPSPTLGQYQKFSRQALPLGIGEIGLDRLKEKKISPLMRSVFETQLKLAAELHCPVVLHGAKCWGEVIATVKNVLSSSNQAIDRIAIQSNNRTIPQSPNPPIPQSPNSLPIPSFLFHGFSRSDGLLPDIVALNGFVSVGPTVLNDHAVNYRELVKKIPLERLLLETDRTPENAATCPSVAAVAAKVAELRGLSLDELELLTDQNATAFQQTCHDFS